MYCASETCPKAWGDPTEQKCYDCEFAITVAPLKINNTEDCPGQLFFDFIHES